jgi:hypothetical protein
MNCQLNPHDAHVRTDSRRTIQPQRREFPLRGAFAAQRLRVTVPVITGIAAPDPGGGRNYQLAVS